MTIRSLLVAVTMCLGVAGAVYAQQSGLQIRPLSYQTTLRADERQQGVVDVANPSNEAVTVSLTVQAYRQTDDGIELYDDPRLASGIILDQDTIQLEGQGAYRVVFEADATRLPSGAVQVAIVATTGADDSNDEQDMVAQRVSVATLLQISNGEAVATPVYEDSDHEAMMTRLILGGAAGLIVIGLIVSIVLRRRKKLAFTKRA